MTIRAPVTTSVAPSGRPAAAAAVLCTSFPDCAAKTVLVVIAQAPIASIRRHVSLTTLLFGMSAPDYKRHATESSVEPCVNRTHLHRARRNVAHTYSRLARPSITLHARPQSSRRLPAARQAASVF